MMIGSGLVTRGARFVKNALTNPLRLFAWNQRLGTAATSPDLVIFTE
jgi:hypothetical protein